METIYFDIEKLRRCEEFSINKAINRFSGGTMLFEELTGFLKDEPSYFRGYEGVSVTSNRATRERLLTDAEKIKRKLSSLGMDKAAGIIDRMTEAAKDGRAVAFDNARTDFSLEMEFVTFAVNSARSFTIEGEDPLSKTITKPVILAADDKPEILATLVTLLKADFTVICVTNGESAIKAIEKHTPRLFLLDIEMPGIDGYELAELIRKKPYFKNAPIIFLTAKNTRGHVLTAIEKGGNDYILKPIEKDLLMAKISKYLH